MPTPEQIADEEARAQLWRDQQIRRVAYQQELWWSLAGDPVARERVRQAWMPVELWLLERDEAPTDPEDDPGYDPLKMRNTVNVGT